jgi:hypothetical protein
LVFNRGSKPLRAGSAPGRENEDRSEVCNAHLPQREVLTADPDVGGGRSSHGTSGCGAALSSS